MRPTRFPLRGLLLLAGLGCGCGFLLLAVFGRGSPATLPPAASGQRIIGPGGATVDADWYQPAEADFRAVYDRDPANAAKQTWASYWDWVQAFYAGSFFTAGWTDQVKPLPAGVTDPAAAAELRTALNELGRTVAGEWSKDNGVRKISNDDLRAMGKRLNEAKQRDGGAGVELRKAVADVRAELAGR